MRKRVSVRYALAIEHAIIESKILDLNGRITLGEGSVQMRDAILGLVGNGNKNIVLNMEDVSDIDSSGLGELVGVCSAAKRLGAKLRLLTLTKKVHDVLQITRLSTSSTSTTTRLRCSNPLSRPGKKSNSDKDCSGGMVVIPADV